MDPATITAAMGALGSLGGGGDSSMSSATAISGAITIGGVNAPAYTDPVTGTASAGPAPQNPIVGYVVAALVATAVTLALKMVK